MSSPEKTAKAPLNASMAESAFPHFVLRQPISRITIGGEWDSQTQLDRTGLHGDILGRYDLPHRAILPIVSTAAHFDVFGVCSGAGIGEFSSETPYSLECALSDARAAHAPRCQLANANLRAARAEAALDHAFPAVFVLDAARRVVYMNRSGEAMASSADGLMLRRNRIIVANASQQSKLKALTTDAISGAQASASQAVGAIALERSFGRRPLFVRVMPLRVDLAGGHTPSGHALLLITDPDGTLENPTNLLKSLFSLTAAEIEVATHLRAGSTLAEIAAVRGVSLETTRSQVKSLLQKTNSRRQSDLILLLTTLIT
jgi:DNA-binding CsgD family transcriptional regulator